MRVKNIIVGSETVGCKWNGNTGANGGTASRIVQLEAALNGERATASTAGGGPVQRRTGTGLGIDNREDARWSYWSVVLKSYTSHAQAADPAALPNGLQMDETPRAASLDLCTSNYTTQKSSARQGGL